MHNHTPQNTWVKLTKVLSIAIVFLWIFFVHTPTILAQGYQTSYEADYFIKGSDILGKISINLVPDRSSVFVRSYSITLPNAESFKHVATHINGLPVIPKEETIETSRKLTYKFNEDVVGRGKKTNLLVEYVQKSAIKKEGGVAEISIPVLSQSGKNIVRLHYESNEPPDIIKPTPKGVDGQTITWQDITDKLITVTFGNTKHFKTVLSYFLQNDSLKSTEKSITLPPQTSYQSIIVDYIKPLPSRVEVDVDGNYLAYYRLNPKEKKNINFEGFVSVNALPNLIPIKVDQQKLTTNNGYWQLGKEHGPMKNAKEVYDWVISNLNYNFDDLQLPHARLGAKGALKKPSAVACMEYTDLFVAMARKSKIPAREINGFAYSFDTNLLPLSLVTDVLHAWPEYYDNDRNLWQPVDPTWGDTAKSDYFNTFDLNHIALAIHGLDQNLPRVVGLDKEKSGKQVDIVPVDTVPDGEGKPTLSISVEKTVPSSKKSMGTILYINNSSIPIVGSKIEIEGKGLNIKNARFDLPLLMPMQEEKLKFEFTPKRNEERGQINVLINGVSAASSSVRIQKLSQNIATTTFGVVIGIVIVAISILGFLYKKS